MLARLREAGAIEVAGPSAAADLRTVSDAMLELGAEQVLIDGAIDRRAASSPAVAEGLVMATGAILSEDIEARRRADRDAVELVRLPRAGERSRSAAAGDGSPGEAMEPSRWRRGLVLNAEPADRELLRATARRPSTFAVEGALGERFLEGLLAARNERSGRELRDRRRRSDEGLPDRAGARAGMRVRASRSRCCETIELKAITVNPLAPQSHRFDSHALRELIEVGRRRTCRSSTCSTRRYLAPLAK